MDDPSLRAQVDAWAKANTAQLVQGFRDLLVRSLDTIDQFVARFK